MGCPVASILKIRSREYYTNIKINNSNMFLLTLLVLLLVAPEDV